MEAFDINSLKVAKPCGISWTSMTGDDQTRVCGACEMNVYNTEEMTAREIMRLLSKPNGRICGRIRRRADGTVITRECPKGLRDFGRRISRIAGAALSTVLALFSVGYGQEPEVPVKKVETKITRFSSIGSNIFVEVTDKEGARIPGAAVTIIDNATGIKNKTQANDIGESSNRITGVGSYQIEVEAAGFETRTIESLKVGIDESIRIVIAMTTSTFVMGDIAIIAVPMIQSETKITRFRSVGSDVFVMVTDNEGALVPGATVTFIKNSSWAKFRTDNVGESSYRNIAAGRYQIKVEQEGFADEIIEPFEVADDESIRIVIVMTNPYVTHRGGVEVYDPGLIDSPDPVLTNSFVNGSISGVVDDDTGATIAGATVNVEGERYNRTFVTDEQGKFEVQSIPAGKYTLTINQYGFKTKVLKNIEVKEDKLSELKVTLSFGGEYVVVGTIDESPLIDMDKTDISTTVNPIPGGRD